MKIKKLKDRDGLVITPLTHIDSVIDSQGSTARKLLAPITHVGSSGVAQHAVATASVAGFMSDVDKQQHDFLQANAIVSIKTSTEGASTDLIKKVVLTQGNKVNLTQGTEGTTRTFTFNHNVIPTTADTSKVTLNVGDSVNLKAVKSVTVDGSGHITQYDTTTYTLPTKVKVTNLPSNDTATYTLNMTSGTSGVYDMSSSASLSYTPVSGVLTAPIVDANLANGSKGSILYQTGANSSTWLSASSAHKILAMSTGGVPEWIDNSGVTGVTFSNGSTAGPVINVARNVMSTLTSTIPSASTSTSGVVTTGAQTFSGNKTFKDNLAVGGNVDITGNLTVIGDVVSTSQSNLEVTDALISIATSKTPTAASGDNAGIVVTTGYQPTEAEKYTGPTFRWNQTVGWQTGNTDTTKTNSTDINIPASSVYRIGGKEVLSGSKLSVNAISADKVNHTLSINGTTFDGSAKVDVITNTVPTGGTGVTTFTSKGVLYGNGTGALQATAAGTANQALVSISGTPKFVTLNLGFLSDSGALVDCADTGMTVADFAV